MSDYEAIHKLCLHCEGNRNVDNFTNRFRECEVIGVRGPKPKNFVAVICGWSLCVCPAETEDKT